MFVEECLSFTTLDSIHNFKLAILTSAFSVDFSFGFISSAIPFLSPIPSSNLLMDNLVIMCGHQPPLLKLDVLMDNLGILCRLQLWLPHFYHLLSTHNPRSGPSRGQLLCGLLVLAASSILPPPKTRTSRGEPWKDFISIPEGYRLVDICDVWEN